MSHSLQFAQVRCYVMFTVTYYSLVLSFVILIFVFLASNENINLTKNGYTVVICTLLDMKFMKN